MTVEELERFGKPYFKCTECEYGALGDLGRAYVETHVAGSHKPTQEPGAEALTALDRGTPGTQTELVDQPGTGEPMTGVEAAAGETVEISQDGAEPAPELETTDAEPAAEAAPAEQEPAE